MAVSPVGAAYEKINPGYWISYDSAVLTKPALDGGYLASGTVLSRYPIVDLDPSAPGAAGIIDSALLAAFNNNELAAFIYKAYQAQINVEQTLSIDLHTDIVRAGLYNPPLTDPYAGIRPLDFMCLTGAKILPEGIATYIPSPGGPTPPTRPNLWEVENAASEDRATMFAVIKFLGLWGLLKHLYIVQGGITWAEFVKCIHTWLPHYEDRAAYFAVFRTFLISKSQPIPSLDKINEFLGI